MIPPLPPQRKVYLNHIWRTGIVKNISYRHSIARILPIHKLDFHCYVSGRTLTVGKIETLRVYVEKVSVKAIVHMIVNVSENTMDHYYTLQKKQMNKYWIISICSIDTMLFLHTMLDSILRVIIQTHSKQIYPQFTDELRPRKVKKFSHTTKWQSWNQNTVQSDFKMQVISSKRGFWEINKWG